MTLRDTCKSFLQSMLEWAKRNRDYWQGIRDRKNAELEQQKWLVTYRYNAFMKKGKGDE